MAKYRAHFPIQVMYNYINLATLGNTPQPFIYYFCEGALLYLVDALTGVAVELISRIKTDILLILD